MADSDHVKKFKFPISPQTFKLLQWNFVWCRTSSHCSLSTVKN